MRDMRSNSHDYGYSSSHPQPQHQAEQQLSPQLQYYHQQQQSPQKASTPATPGRGLTESQFVSRLQDLLLARFKSVQHLFKHLCTLCQPGDSVAVLPFEVWHTFTVNEIMMDRDLDTEARKNPDFFARFMTRFPDMIDYSTFARSMAPWPVRGHSGTEHPQEPQVFQRLRRELAGRSTRLTFVLEQVDIDQRKLVASQAFRTVLQQQFGIVFSDAEFSEFLARAPRDAASGYLKYMDLLRRIEGLLFKERGLRGSSPPNSPLRQPGYGHSSSASMVSGPSSPSSSSANHMTWIENKVCASLEMMGKQASLLLHRCDTSGRGLLTLDDLKRFLNLVKIEFLMPQLHALFAYLPKDASGGYIDAAAFLRMLSIDDGAPVPSRTISHQSSVAGNLKDHPSSPAQRGQYSPTRHKERLALERCLRSLSQCQTDIVMRMSRGLDRQNRGYVSPALYRQALLEVGVPVSDMDINLILSLCNPEAVRYHEVPQIISAELAKGLSDNVTTSEEHAKEEQRVAVEAAQHLKTMHKHVYMRDAGDIIGHMDANSPEMQNKRAQGELFRTSTRSFYSPSGNSPSQR